MQVGIDMKSGNGLDTLTVCRFKEWLGEKEGSGVFEERRWGDTPMHTMIKYASPYTV